MGIINEAPYKIRRSYVILLALWYGSKKPPRNAFFRESIGELKRLETEGFEVKGKRYKLRVLIITTDTVARPLVWFTSQFNGEYGCDICLMKGERVPKGKGSVRVYPEPDDSASAQIPLRSLNQHMNDVARVIETGKYINGIQGRTPFADLTDFDFVKACVPEYMHSCCQGVIKQFIQLWFSKKYSKKMWYIGNKSEIVNSRLWQIKPPYEVTRTPGKIDDLSDWKASSYRSFALYYFQVLENVLPSDYFKHFSKFSYGLFVLLQEEVLVTDVQKIEMLFKNFVIEAKILYGVEHIGINVHFLTHLPRSVIDWGCLWSTSTFIPEWFNGQLNSLCNGSQAIAQQMAQNYLLKLAIRDEAITLMEGTILPPDVSQTLEELLHLPKKEYCKGRFVNNNMIELLGSSECRYITTEEEVALRNLFSKENIIIEMNAESEIRGHFYPRFKLPSHSIFTSSTYDRSPRRSNYCALLKDGMFIFIEAIVCLESQLSWSFVIGREVGILSKRTYLPLPIADTSFSHISGQTTKLVGVDKSLKAFKPEDIISKCVVALNNCMTEMVIASRLPNNFETD